MRKVMKIMCIICVCLCLIRGLFGVVDPVGGFDIVPKLERFAQAEVFDFRMELAYLQLSKFAFNNMVSPYNTAYGQQFTFYRVATWADPFFNGDIENPNYVRVETIIVDGGDYVQPVGMVRYVREEKGFFRELADSLGAFWDFVVNIMRLLAESVYSMFEVVYQLCLLVLDIIFDVST